MDYQEHKKFKLLYYHNSSYIRHSVFIITKYVTVILALKISIFVSY